MAKLMSKKTRETMTTITFIVIVGLFATFFIIYPLIKVDDMITPEIMNVIEPDTTEYPTFEELGILPDTLTVISDDNTNLSTLYMLNSDLPDDSINGTILIVPSIFSKKENYASLMKLLAENNFNLFVYDQRGAGQSTGDYYTPGVYEADDMNQFLVHLKLHDMIKRPVIVLGYKTGGDAAIYASQNAEYIDFIIADAPYLTPAQWIDNLNDLSGAMSIPFSNAVYYWWYEKKSGHVIGRSGVDEIEPAGVPTVLVGDDDFLSSEEAERFKEISDGKVSLIKKSPDNQDELILRTIEALTRAPQL